ncbi:50S ribosomal protein L25 [Paenibacillus sp. KS-LC4]|uniref:50S ribosomal protein L25 n=1 Tax=Paenibacillus sp. KS-LC4 TaxID=2979727 RepID=UPI0030D491D0
MMSNSMIAETRAALTNGELRSLRQRGKVPAVVYGKQLSQSTAVLLEEKELLALLRSHPKAVLELNIPSHGKKPVMITEVQRDPVSRQVLHVDFHQINMNEEVKTQVRIDFLGEANGVKEGGILQVMLHELEVQCLPGSIPDSIELNVADLEMGSNLLVSDIVVPSGVEVKSDHQQVVVTVLAPQKEISEEEAAESAAESFAQEVRSEDAKEVSSSS